MEDLDRFHQIVTGLEVLVGLYDAEKDNPVAGRTFRVFRDRAQTVLDDLRYYLSVHAVKSGMRKENP